MLKDAGDGAGREEEQRNDVGTPEGKSRGGGSLKFK